MQGWKPVVVAAALVLVAGACTTVVRGSVASDGTPANAPSQQGSAQSISDNGRYVIFSSSATNLAAQDTNGFRDVFRHDNKSGATVRISISPSGAQIPAESAELAISGDGDSVAFVTTASLVPADTNGLDDVYVRTVSTGTTDWVSVRPDGQPAIDASTGDIVMHASISDNGNRVLLVTGGPVAGGVFLRDRGAATTTVLAGPVENAILSGDGTSMVASEVCTTGTCTHRAFIQPLTAGAAPVEIDTRCGFIPFDVSSDARYVVGQRFGLPPSWTCPDPIGLVRWDRTTKAFTAVPLMPGGAPSITTSISNDGRFVASNGSDLVPRVIDLKTGVIQTTDADAADQRGSGPSFSAALSGSGRYVTFTSDSKLTSNDTDTSDDIYTRFSMQPTVSGTSPASITRGASHKVVTITGTEFLSGLTVSVSGDGVTVNSVTLVSPTKVQADLSVTSTAPIGARDVVVDNLSAFGHSDGRCTACLSVS